jgi:hypothetical protein
MKAINFTETESVEVSGVIDLGDETVKIFEREIHKVISFRDSNNIEKTAGNTPRLVIGDAVEQTKVFVSKTRAELSELNSVLSEMLGAGRLSLR